MKKLLALVMALVLMCLAFAGCGAKDNDEDAKNTEYLKVVEDLKKVEIEIDEANEDIKYIKEKGKLVVGITDFAPMDYKVAGSEEWVGFDADMAKGFAAALGVDVEFQLIDWNSKIMELDGKTIDCVWNGMTLTDEVKAGMDCTDAYLINAQVVVLNKDKAEQYKTAEDCKALNFAVETGSAGEKMAQANGFKFTAVKDQATALMEVKSGTSDAAIIDLLMAGATIGEGTSYENLTYTAKLSTEEYGVGFRKGSGLKDALNAYFDATLKNGLLEKVAVNYGVQESIAK